MAGVWRLVFDIASRTPVPDEFILPMFFNVKGNLCVKSEF